MFFEKLSDNQVEEFAGSKLCRSILNLNGTSYGQSEENLHLIRTISNSGLTRHYVSDVRWINCENGVNNAVDVSRKWQAYIMHCLKNFEDKRNYAEFLREYYESDKKTKNNAERILDEVFEQADIYEGIKFDILEV